jgi:hypothetical protein
MRVKVPANRLAVSQAVWPLKEDSVFDQYKPKLISPQLVMSTPNNQHE